MRPDELYYRARGMLALRALALRQREIITEDVRDMLTAEGLQPVNNQAVMAGLFAWASGKSSGPLLKPSEPARFSAPRTVEARRRRHDYMRIYESVVYGKSLADLPPAPKVAEQEPPPTLFDLMVEST